MFDVKSISLAIGSVAGQNGPLECVIFHACSVASARERAVCGVLEDTGAERGGKGAVRALYL